MDALFVAFVVCCFLSSVLTFGVDFHCPLYFRNGENNVTCKINTTAIEEAQCSSKYHSVTFRRTIYSQTTVVCRTPNYDPAAVCTPAGTHTPGTCWCDESSGGIITYKFTFLANSSVDEGGQLECKLCVLPENPLDVSVSESCKNMSFASYNAPEQKLDEEDNFTVPPITETKTTALVIAIVTVVVIVIAAVVVGILFKRRWNRICKSKRTRNQDNKDVQNGTLILQDKENQHSVFAMSANENGKEEERNGFLPGGIQNL